MPPKRARATSATGNNQAKRQRSHPSYSVNVHGKIATAEAAAGVDADPPFHKLCAMMQNQVVQNPSKGKAIVYWMRMEDLRIVDNRAISEASQKALREGIPLIVIHVLSPGDFKAHVRSARRVDFVLRNLKIIKKDLEELNIPLYVITHSPRHDIPRKVVSLLQAWDSNHLFANVEYAVDELRRDMKVFELASEAGVHCTFLEDKLLVNPGVLSTKEGKQYAVYSPWQRNWLNTLNGNLHWLDEASGPKPNPESVKVSEEFHTIFDTSVPESVEGFECEDKEKMAEVWPAGTDVARQILKRFLTMKASSSQLGAVSPFPPNGEESAKKSRLLMYKDSRDQTDKDSSSRLSPYLAAGIISARECVRETMELLKSRTVVADRESNVGMWVQEIAWRDFYTHVMVAFPRVSMGRPFLEKYADVKWETNAEHLQAWKDGKTGYPIVDAAMRQIKTMGWMHNRARMITAMFLTRDLMLDWRLGEEHFMDQLIDGDLASNNGGWQWSASTGTDPQPYFRIFNPHSQSQKADPSGEYIRHFVPELAGVTGPEIHNPSTSLADRLGYPRPIVDHAEARQRALRRYKNPGSM